LSQYKRLLALFFSLSLHLVLLFFINQQFQQDSTKVLVSTNVKAQNVLKSFIYQQPIKRLKIDKTTINTVVAIEKKIIEKNDSNTKVDDGEIKSRSTNKGKKERLVSLSAPVQTENKKVSFSALSLLSNLSKKLDEQSIELAIKDRNRSLAAKIMAGIAPIVPHSVTEETLAEQASKTALSMNYYADAVIFKDDDGICTQIRDLSKVGMEGLTEIRRSRCGPSKFDKSFKKHMSAVIDKVKPIR